MHTNTYKYTNAHTHKNTHTHTRTHTHTYAHAHVHALSLCQEILNVTHPPTSRELQIVLQHGTGREWNSTKAAAAQFMYSSFPSTDSIGHMLQVLFLIFDHSSTDRLLLAADPEYSFLAFGRIKRPTAPATVSFAVNIVGMDGCWIQRQHRCSRTHVLRGKRAASRWQDQEGRQAGKHTHSSTCRQPCWQYAPM